MNKSYLLAIIAVFFIAPSAHAFTLNEMNTVVNLNSDRSSDWNVGYIYSENISQSDFFNISKIVNVEVFADSKPIKCEISEKNIGTLILCKNANASNLLYKFTALNSVTASNNLNIFKYNFPVLQLTGNFTVIVKLPLGTGVIEEHKLEGSGQHPYEPTWGEQNTDGRQIFIKWKLENPEVGDKINVTVIYEELSGIDILTLLAIIIISSAVILVVFFTFRRKSMKGILPILTEGERKVMEIVLREGKVDQRVVVKETDFSKAKASRVIQDLEKRGLIEKTSIGRKNILKLKKDYKKEETKK